MRISRLPDAELEVMQIIWECPDAESGVTSAYIMQKLEGKRNWVVTTVLNFLARLVERGFLTAKRSGKINRYTPLIQEEDYLKSESKSFLERLHGNSLKSLVASLYGGKAVSLQDLKELRQFIEERAVDTP
jgi:predicted transcriptional regulator